MIASDNIREIIATYAKHGWNLRRVLLSARLSERLGDDKNGLFGEAPVLASDIDAAWFSRPPKPGGVAWEIRYLGEPAFALLEKADEDDAEFETILADVQSRLHDAIAAKTVA